MIFAAPILSENAIRIIDAATRLDGVRLGVITQDFADKVPSSVAQHWRVNDVLDVEQLSWAAENVAARIGGADVLFAAYEQLQVPNSLPLMVHAIVAMSALPIRLSNVRTTYGSADRGLRGTVGAPSKQTFYSAR